MTQPSMNLYDAKPSDVYQIISFPKIHLLESLGLRHGTKVRVENRYRFGGPILLRVEDAFAVAIGKDVATQIGVRAL